MSQTLSHGSFTRNFVAPSGRDPVTPRFHLESVHDVAASEREGRPIYRTEERVQHMIPGGLNCPVERVNPSHIERWPDAYKAFKAGIEMAADGTPLEEWNILQRAQVLELKGLGFHRIEDVAGASDFMLQKIPRMGHRLRELAKAYLDDAEASKLTTQLSSLNERLTTENAELTHKVDELRTLVDRLHHQLQAKLDAPGPIETYVPPAGGAAVGGDAGAVSALESLGEPRRRGRPKVAA